MVFLVSSSSILFSHKIKNTKSPYLLVFQVGGPRKPKKPKAFLVLALKAKKNSRKTTQDNKKTKQQFSGESWVWLIFFRVVFVGVPRVLLVLISITTPKQKAQGFVGFPSGWAQKTTKPRLFLFSILVGPENQKHPGLFWVSKWRCPENQQKPCFFMKKSYSRKTKKQKQIERTINKN